MANKNDSNMADDDSIAAVMADLVSDAVSPVKDVLLAYDQTLGYEDNLSKIESLSVCDLEATASFLGQEARFGSANIQRYRSLRTLADWIIMRIEGLFPQTCLECCESYTIRRTDDPPVRCNYCGGGLHNCPTILEAAGETSRAKSRVWMCNGCLAKHTLERFSCHMPVDTTALDPTLNSTRRSSGRDQVLLTTQRPEVVQMRSGNEDFGVCKFYVQRRCRHGKSGTKLVNGVACRKSHPRLCKKYCSYGSMARVGCQATDCAFFHPPLCRNSELRHECLKVNCTKQHLKDTRRVRPNTGDSGPQRSRAPAGSTNQNRDPRTRSRSGTQGRDGVDQRSGESHQRSRTQSTARFQDAEPSPAFLDALIDRLRESIAGLVATEVQRYQVQPAPPFTASQQPQLPPGMMFTTSPHPVGLRAF